MANNKAKYEIQVDIDVKSGKINSDKLLADVNKQVKAKLSANKAQKVKAPISFDTSKILSDIDKIAAAIDRRLRTQIRNISQSDTAGTQKSIQAIADLEMARTQAAKSAKRLNKDVTKSVKTAVAQQLTERAKAGKSLDGMTKKANVLRTAIKGIFKKGESGLQGFGDLVDKGAAALKKAASSGYNFGNAMRVVTERSAAAKKVIKELAKEGLAVSKSFSASFGGGKAVAKGPNLGQVEAGLNGVKKRSVEAEAALSSMAAAMARAGKQQNAMSLGLAKISSGLKQQAKDSTTVGTAQQKLEAATSDYAKAQKELAAATEKLNVVNKAGLSPSSRIAALKSRQASIERNIVSLSKLRDMTKAAGNSTLKFDRDLKRLQKQLRKTEAALRGPTKTMLEFANSLKTFVRFAVAFKVLGGISQAVKTLAGSVIELDDALVSVKTIANATSQEMESVENAVKNVATTTQFTTTEIAQAAQVLAQAGIGPDAIATTLSAVANFAAATNASLTVASDIISTVKNVFRELDPEDIADKLTNAVNISKLTATGLQTIFSRLAQTAKSFSLDLDQVLGASAVLKNVGIKDSTISTGFRQGLLELLSPDEKTLKVLEKRYADIGESMSKTAISSLFSNFQNDANPLLRVLDELERLGIQGSGAQDFERLFDVRATNVINALIDNKEQFVKNTEAIGRTGSAAKGAKTQLESLAKSADNLLAIVTTLAADLSGPLLDSLKGIVGGATDAANAFRDMFNAQKEITGSSGIGSSIGLGVAAGTAAASRGLGAGKSAIAGLLSAGIATVINSNSGKGQGFTEGVTDSLTTVLNTVAGLSILKAFFPAKQLTDLDKASSIFKTKIPSIKDKFAKGVTALKGTLSRIPVLLTLVSVAIFGVSTLLKNLFDSSLEDTLESIKQRSSALSKRVEDNKAALDKAKKEVEDLSSKEALNQSTNRKASAITDQVTEIVETAERQVLAQLVELDAAVKKGSIDSAGIDQSLTDIFTNPEVKRERLRQDVSQVFSDQTGGTRDVGSAQFAQITADVNAQLEALGVRAVTAKELSALLIKQDNLIAEAEGRRLLFAENLTAALDASEDPNNKEFLEAWNNLSDTEKAAYQTSIETVEEATSFIDQINDRDNLENSAKLKAATEKQAKAQADLDAAQRKKLDLQIEAIEAAQKSANRTEIGAALDQVFIDFSGPNELIAALYRDLSLDGKDILDLAKESIADAEGATQTEINKGKALLSVAVESGLTKSAVDISKALLKVAAITADEANRAIEAAANNAEATARREIQARLKSLAEGRRTEDKKTPFDQKQETETVEADTETRLQNRAAAIRVETDLQDALQRILEKQLESVGDQEKLNALTKQRTQIESLIKDQSARILDLGTSREVDEQKVKDVKQGFLFDELRIKELTKKISEAKGLVLRDEEKFTELLSQRLALEEQALEAQKRALTQSIKNELERKGATGFENKSLEGILSGIEASQVLATKGYETLAGLVGEAVQVQDKLTSAQERYTADLDNFLRKDLNAKLSKAQTKLTNQQNTTRDIENKLNTASDNLTKSREELAKIYDKQAEDERFFENLRRGFAGEAGIQKGDAKDLNKRARATLDPQERATLAKEAATLAKSLVDAGELSRSQGERIAKDSEGIVRGARGQEATEKQAEIAANQQRVIQLNAQHVASLASEKLLQGSVDGLKASIDSLPDRLKKALEAASGSKRGTDKSTKGLEKAGKGLTKSAKDSSNKLTDAANNLSDSADNLKVAAGRIGSSTRPQAEQNLGTAGDGIDDAPAQNTGDGRGTTSFISDLGKNFAEVAAGDTTRLSNLKSSGIDPNSALAKSILQSVSPSVIPQRGFSVGGLITGPGNGKDDKAGTFSLSDREFVQPSSAVEKYGVDFMEKIRTLSLPVEAVRAMPAVGSSGAGSGGASAAEAVAKAFNEMKGNDLRPVTLNVAGSTFETNSTDGNLDSFRKSLSMQALKSGRRAN